MDTIQTVTLIIQSILCMAWLYLYGEQKRDKERIKSLEEMQTCIIHDLLLIMRKDAIQEEDYRKVLDIDKILNKK